MHAERARRAFCSASPAARARERAFVRGAGVGWGGDWGERALRAPSAPWTAARARAPRAPPRRK
eukprot:6314577-Prymnesium_polylepis.1